MSHDITPVNEFTADVTVPDNGDALDAGSVDDAFQAVTNRTVYLNDQKNLTNLAVTTLKNGFAGLLIGARNAASSDGTHITVEGFQKMYIGNVPFDAQAAATVAPGSDSNDTWHYLYGYESLGLIAYERSTTGPDASRTFKSGDATRVYICSYYVDGSGNIRPFFKHANKVTWRRSKISDYVIATATPSTYTDQSLSAWMPSHSYMATLECIYVDSAGTAKFRTNGDTTNLTKAVGAGSVQEFNIETDGSQVIEYKLEGASSPVFAIQAVGYYE